MCKWWQYLAKFGEMRKAHPQWREGQAYFNALEELLPDFANEIRGTKLDPFYHDDRIDAFREWLSLKLE